MEVTVTVKSGINVSALRSVIQTNKGRIQTIACKAVEGSMKRRIFNTGKRTDGSLIGHYKSYPAYFGREAFVKKGSFSPDEGRKTMFFSQGWGGGSDSLRAVQGRQTAKVDFDYSGSLRASLIVGSNGSNVVLGFSDLEEIAKKNGLERRYGVVFSPSENEIKAGEDAALIAIKDLAKASGFRII